jgi:hypothetical protein
MIVEVGEEERLSHLEVRRGDRRIRVVQRRIHQLGAMLLRTLEAFQDEVVEGLVDV